MKEQRDQDKKKQGNKKLEEKSTSNGGIKISKELERLEK